MNDPTPKNLAESLSPESLILRLRSNEHNFVERKPRNQKGEWLQVAVAFANSTPIGWPAVLFVGVNDEGTPQQGPEKLEDLSKSVSDTLERAYPPIYPHIVPLHLPTGSCLAVVIPGSEERPHFAGKSYVREGPQTKEASEQQFEKLIAERQSIVRELLRWRGKPVTVRVRTVRGLDRGPYERRVLDCNQFYVTFVYRDPGLLEPEMKESYTIRGIELSYDHGIGRLLIFCQES